MIIAIYCPFAFWSYSNVVSPHGNWDLQCTYLSLRQQHLKYQIIMHFCDNGMSCFFHRSHLVVN